ncbi:hypothetical protein TNCV_1527561 [Trichonephila clavipes]|nr:hypothetical protein TNCV_1527561 [Trichonephila clavipes]
MDNARTHMTHKTFSLPTRCGCGSLVVKVTDSFLMCQEFEPSTDEDPPFWAPMHVKYVETQMYSHWWGVESHCSVTREIWATDLITLNHGQVTRKTSVLAPPFPNFCTLPTGGRLNPDRFNVNQPSYITDLQWYLTRALDIPAMSLLPLALGYCGYSNGMADTRLIKVLFVLG